MTAPIGVPIFKNLVVFWRAHTHTHIYKLLWYCIRDALSTDTSERVASSKLCNLV